MIPGKPLKHSEDLQELNLILRHITPTPSINSQPQKDADDDNCAIRLDHQEGIWER